MDVGEHCAVAGCQALDFLSFTCDNCGIVTCADHRLPAAHACIDLEENQDCAVVNLPTDVAKFSSCSVAGCSLKDLTVLACEDCTKPHCLKHRHPDAHGCPIAAQEQQAVEDKLARQSAMQKAASAKAAATNETAQIKDEMRKSKKKLTGKKLARSRLIAAMKMKSKAFGDSSVPQSDRVYLSVTYDNGVMKPSEVALFFKSSVSVGKILDVAAKKHSAPLRGDPPLVLYRMDKMTALLTGSQLNELQDLPSGSALLLSNLSPDVLLEKLEK